MDIKNDIIPSSYHAPPSSKDVHMGGARPTTKKSLAQPKKIVPKILAQTAKPEVIHKTPVPQASTRLEFNAFVKVAFSAIPRRKTFSTVIQGHQDLSETPKGSRFEHRTCLPSSETSFDLPPLRGNSIDEHFYNIGAHMAMPWLEIAMNFTESKEKGLPPRPEKFNITLGGLDTTPMYSPFPVMACAISETARYVWISPWLLGLDSSPEHLIPIGDPSLPRVILARVLLPGNALLGYCIGSKNETYERQLKEIEEIRALLADIESQPELDRERHDNLLAVKADLEGSLPTLVHTPDEITGDDSDAKRWEEVTSVNSLADLARLYCGIDLDKSTRDDFMTSTREGIAANIDKYLQYCCSDVETTLSIYQIVLPAFLRSCPNPVSAAGIFTMGSAFLTVDQEWNNYINSAEQKYHELEDGVRGTLLALAKDAFAMYDSDVEGKKPWESDEWLSQLDWTPKKVGVSRGIEAPERPPPETRPKWFADITKEKLGPTVQDRVIPLLLNMKWKPDPSSKKKTTYPLFFSSKHGWLVGSAKKNQSGLGSTVEVDENDELAPFRGHIVCDDDDLTNMALRFCSGTAPDSDWDALRSIANSVLDEGPHLQKILKSPFQTPTELERVQVGKRPSRNPADIVYWPKWYWDLTAPRTDAERGTPNLTFLQAPHKDGDQANVGSPMAKTFLKYSQDGTLSSPGDTAKAALNMNAQCSYWISARDRVLRQVVMWDRQAKINMGLPTPPPPSPPPGPPMPKRAQYAHESMV
ncbi:DNA polymerase gamma 1 [Rhizoctonia solani]|uniref:DNA polymerase gamma 1 n=1 Tax=Rhizoctonia solani TaxID=456999 RepID=A0A8H8SUU5_9AGAM|nr:DNA polymerase gamma 1 [Rhizoctonia solani]QRW18834.1 DNA polymerase gamma 1 [Rhizoctonia solani]